MVDDGGDAAEHPFPELVRTTLDLADLGIGPTTAIVIATQGHYDDLALQAALATEAGYVGVIAAEKRASSLLQSLRDEGVDETQLARVHAPAGLDLGALENAEIAVAVLADLVARRAAGQLRGGPVVMTRPEAIDPVCGMTVFVDSAKYHISTDGTDYYFCSAGCQRAFEADPAAFAALIHPTLAQVCPLSALRAGPLGPRSLPRVDSGSASHPCRLPAACVSLLGGIPASRRSLRWSAMPSAVNGNTGAESSVIAPANRTRMNV